MTAESHVTVLATYPDMEKARGAIDSLQNRGIDAVEIEVGGASAVRADRDTAVETQTAGRDTAIAGHVAGRAVVGGLVGASIGAIAGVLMAALDISPIGDNYGVQVLMWGLFGLILGALVGGVSSLSSGNAWELTFEPNAKGPVTVGMHTDDPELIQRARDILTGPSEAGSSST